MRRKIDLLPALKSIKAPASCEPTRVRHVDHKPMNRPRDPRLGVAKLFQVLRQRKVFKDGKTFISGGGHMGGAASIEVRRCPQQGPVPLGPMPCDLALETAVPLMKARARRKSPEGALSHTELPEGTL